MLFHLTLECHAIAKVLLLGSSSQTRTPTPDSYQVLLLYCIPNVYYSNLSRLPILHHTHLLLPLVIVLLTRYQITK